MSNKMKEIIKRLFAVPSRADIAKVEAENRFNITKIDDYFYVTFDGYIISRKLDLDACDRLAELREMYIANMTRH